MHSRSAKLPGLVFVVGLLLAAARLAAAQAPGPTGQWVNGLPGGDIGPYPGYQHEGLLIAAGPGLQGIKRSDDYGQTWYSISNGIQTPSNMAGVLISAVDDRIMYAADFNRGVYKTTDGGASWQLIFTDTSKYPGWWVMSQASSDVVYMTTYSRTYRTIDGGSTWQPLGPSCEHQRPTAIDPANPDIVYFANGPWRSTDGGATCSQLANLNLAPIPAPGGTRLYGIDGPTKIYRSDDGGTTWIPAARVGFPTSGTLWGFTVDPHDQAHIAATVSGAGVFQSWDGGETWTTLNIGYPIGQERGVVFGWDTPSTLYAGTNLSGLWHYRFNSTGPTSTATPTATAAAQWQLLGFSGMGVYSVAVSPNFAADHTMVVGAAYPIDIYRSTDGGQTWSAVHPPTQLYSLRFSPNYSNDQTLFANSHSGVYRSTDGGLNWSQVGLVGQDFGLETLAISPNYASDQTVFAGTIGGHVYRSTDRGLTWTDLGLLSSGKEIRTFALSPNFANDHTIFVGVGVAWDWYTGGVFRSTNSGDTWTAVNTGLAWQEVHALAISPNYAVDQTLVVAPWGGGVYRSTNGGNSWSQFNTGLTTDRSNALAFSPDFSSDQTLFFGTWGENYNGGVFNSTNSGATWTGMNTGLTTRFIHVLAVSPNYGVDHTLWAGGELGNGGGLWVYGTPLLATPTPTPGATPTSTSTPTFTATLTQTAAPSLTPSPTSTQGFTATTTATPTASPGLKPWTFMIYLAGDNNLYPFLDRAVANLEAQPANPNVNIIVLFDADRNNDTWRFLVQPGGNYTIGVNKWYLGEKNMGDPQTLSDFITWTRDNYPAQHYYLALADHGRGTSGVAWDDTNAHDNLTTTDLRTALNTATNSGQWKLDVVHYDTCLMAMLENAYQIKDYADYMVASENLGWSVFAYERYTQAGALGVQDTNAPYEFAQVALQVTASTTGRQLAVNIADSYFTHPSIQSYPRTISVLDLGQAAGLRQAVDTLAAALRANLGSVRTYVQNTRSATQKFDSRDYYVITNDDEYVDLYHLAQRLKAYVPNSAVQTAAQGVLDALTTGGFVVAEHHQSGMWAGDQELYWDLDNAHGVSIYFPPLSGSTDYNRYTTHQLFRFTSEGQWDEFLVDYFGVMGLPPETGNEGGLPPMLSPNFALYLPIVIR